MWFLIAWVIGDLVGFASAWFLAHGLGYRKGYAAGQISAQRRGEVNLGPKRRLIPVAVSGCDDRSGGSQGSGPLVDHNLETPAQRLICVGCEDEHIDTTETPGTGSADPDGGGAR